MTMPIVISYEDAEALGQLAQSAGEADRDRFNQQLLQRYDASRNATAANLQGIEARERQAGLDRQFRARQAGLDRQFTANQQQQQLAAQQQRFGAEAQQSALDRQARMERAMMDAGLDMQGQQLDYQRDVSLMDRRHQQRLEEIAARNAYSGETRDAAGQRIDPSDRAEQEAQEFAGDIPFDTRSTRAVQTDDTIDQAKSLSMLPDERLNELLQGNPEGKWSRYIQHVLQSRQQQQTPRTTSGGTASSAARTSRSRQQQGGRGQALSERGQGLGDTGLDNVADADLERLANNPQLLKQYLQQQQQGNR